MELRLFSLSEFLLIANDRPVINPIKYDVTYVYRETLYLIEFAYYEHYA